MSGFLYFLLIFTIWNSNAKSPEKKVVEVPQKPDWINFATSRLKSILRRNGISDLPKVSRHILPPNYMIELYHKETKENFLQLLDQETATVRCIMSKIKRETLNFNLSSLSSNENISRAEVRVFRKKSRHGKLPRIKFFLSSHRTRSYAPRKYLPTTFSLPSTPGWQTIDVTKILKASLRKWESIGLSIESLIPEFGSRDEVYYTMPLDELLRIAYKPFLVIFSSKKETSPFQKETPEKVGAEEDNRSAGLNTWKEGGKESRKRESNRIPVLNDYHFQINQRPIGENNELENVVNPILTLGKEKKAEDDDDDTGPDPGLPKDDNEISVRDQFEEVETPFRNDISPHFLTRRSIGDNGFSSNDFLSYLSSIQKSQPNGLLSVVKPKIYTRIENKMDNRVLPPPDDISWTHRKKNRKTRRRYKQKSKNQNYPEAFKSFNSSGGDDKKYTASGECGMQEFSVTLDFDWADQIIAPALFPFNYCTGTCSYSKENDGFVERVDFCEEEIINPWVLTSFLWPTNQESSSNACCIPIKLGRLSLLFVDKFDTIVLKSYPNATITGCSCRS